MAATHDPSVDSSIPGWPEGRSAWWLRGLAALPWSLLYAMTGALAWLIRHFVRVRVGVARANLQRCFPELPVKQIEALLDAHYRHLGQVAAECIKLVRIPAAEMLERTTMLNWQPVLAEVAAGRSVILLAAHQCNWEWVLHAVTLRVGVPLDAAYKPLHSRGADLELRRLRTRYGANLVAAKRLVRELARRRGTQHCLAMMADQMPSSSASRQWLQFLGTDTAFYPGPGELARLSGYAAFFVAMRRIGRGRYECRAEPLATAGERLETAEFTARYAACVERQVRAAPADWTWGHRRWKLQRPPQPAADGSTAPPP